MRDVNELDLERADFDAVVRLHLVEPDFVGQPVLFETPFHQRQREGRAVHGNVDLAQQERHRADVVLVAVRQNERAHVLAVLFQIGEIGCNDVDAQQLGVRKHHAGVHHDDVVAVADGHGVHSKLAQAAERDELELLIWHLRFQGIRWRLLMHRASGRRSTMLRCRNHPRPLNHRG